MARGGVGFHNSRGGRLQIRTNAGAAANAVAKADAKISPGLLADAKKRAAEIQTRMQEAALIQYSKSGTGRFARGIHAKVSQSKQTNVSETVIRVTSVNYRESKFLTNIGDSGYFKIGYPIEPYTIWAKGAEGAAEEVPIGVNPYTKTNYKRVSRLRGVGRLKVPRAGAFFVAARKPGRGGGESRFLRGLGANVTPEQVASGTAGFFYPLKVEHPGFKRDVISNIAQEEQEKFISGARGVVSRSFDDAVSDEIPLKAVGVSIGRSTGTSGRRFS